MTAKVKFDLYGSTTRMSYFAINPLYIEAHLTAVG